jgi:hypothetical protein
VAPRHVLILFGLALVMTGWMAEGALAFLLFVMGTVLIFAGGLKALTEGGAPPSL